MSVISEHQVQLASFEPIENCVKSTCPGCKASRMYFCYDCRTPMPGVFTPSVKLPCQVDIIKHPMEKNSKSSALHCKIVAPEQTRVFDHPDVHDYREDSEEVRQGTAVIFPSESAISVEEFVGVMQKTPEIQGLQHVSLGSYRTAFWRPQHNVPETGLATIEAIYYSLRELVELGLARKYGGEFDNLLYWFFHTKHLVDARQNEYLRRNNAENR
ncbi:unnamed protein product [Caenorhabditis sp. 36 PRJEB53466]|nr:unnamed protein product [Caenorhabditis sp. 36 PRJEB53466]